jgi:hypothetical protein
MGSQGGNDCADRFAWVSLFRLITSIRRRTQHGLVIAALAIAAGACAYAPVGGLDFNGVRLDPAGQVAPDLLKEATAEFEGHRGKVETGQMSLVFPTKVILSDVPRMREDVMGIIDFRLPADARRLFLVNLKDGSVNAFYVAHGLGSGQSLRPRYFSNQMNSDMSAVGSYIAANQYDDGDFSGSVRLHGLDPTNSCAFWRAIVIHEADYVNPDRAPRGLRASNGCIVLDAADRPVVAETLKDGGFLYAGPISLHMKTSADGGSSQAMCEASGLIIRAPQRSVPVSSIVTAAK